MAIPGKLLNTKWRGRTRFPRSRREPIEQAYGDIIAFIEALRPGEGISWVRRNLWGVSFAVGGLPATLVSRLRGARTTVVFPSKSIWLATNFDDMHRSQVHIVHELAHIIDNVGGSPLPATIFGGGRADKLMHALGVRPHGLRFRNASSIPVPLRWSNTINQGYGNTATAEYFAESFCWAIYAPEKLPSPAVYAALLDVLFS